MITGHGLEPIMLDLVRFLTVPVCFQQDILPR
jgi:hypothetical protein